jgi:4-amino-4-deoxy-L-arabinose transferase-like glycosyltransferase
MTGLERIGLGTLTLLTLLYVVGLDRAPAFVGSDEAHFAGQALSIATTGRDLNGRFLPLFVEILDPLAMNQSLGVWYQPMLFYFMALVLKVLPVAEWSIRLPMALVAVLNCWLTYAVGRRVFAKRGYAVLAALMLAMTPAQFIMSRQALDYLAPLPFVLGWTWCLLRFFESGSRSSLMTGGALLGIGLYSYVASWMMMPFYLALTLLLLRRHSATPWRSSLQLCGAFAVPVLLAPFWLYFHPVMLSETVARYHLAGADSVPLLQRITAMVDVDLGRRVSLYWHYFNPSFLFFAGGSHPTQSTARVGVFLLPVAVFLVFGVHRLWTERRRPQNVLLLVGLFSAPLPIVLVVPQDPEYSIARLLVLLPFAALVAATGVEWLIQRPSRAWRMMTIALLMVMPVQYAAFQWDYFSTYQLRATPRLDPLNTRDVTAYILDRDRQSPVPRVYLADNDQDEKAVSWRFHLLKHGRMDLWERTRYFIPNRLDTDGVAPGSLIVFYAADPAAKTLLDQGHVTLAATIRNLAADPSALIFERNR